MGQMSEARHLVVRDIKDPEMNIVVEARYLSQQVMGDVKLLKIDQFREALDVRNPVGLYGKNFQILKA